MIEKILEIIAYVVAELKRDKTLSTLDLTELVDRGYSATEISAAISWLMDKSEFPESPETEELYLQPASQNSFRSFHDVELEMFSSDALSRLLQYSYLGLINSEQVEALIDRASLSGIAKVSPEDVRNIVAYNMFKQNLELPPGYRFTLLGNETIN